MVKEAIELWINTALDDGQPIPKAKSMEHDMADPNSRARLEAWSR